MEVVSFKLYQRKLMFDDLSAMFSKVRGEREWHWRRRAGCVCVGGGGGGGGGQTDRDRVRVVFIICFSTVLQVTAVEVKPIC